jgi:hypothetical protein
MAGIYAQATGGELGAQPQEAVTERTNVPFYASLTMFWLAVIPAIVQYLLLR